MIAAERETIRALVDREVRSRLEPLQRAFAGVLYCSRCGIELDDWTPGCHTCWDRWDNWRRRCADDFDVAVYNDLRRRSEAYSYQRRVAAPRRHNPKPVGGGWRSDAMIRRSGWQPHLTLDGAFNQPRTYNLGERRFS